MIKKRGSAIVISMLLISAIAVVAFSIARMIYSGSQMVQLYENGAIAYYAAESGIEEGFLRYRYNQNAKVPFDFNVRGSYRFLTNLSSIDMDSFVPSAETGDDFSGKEPVLSGRETNQVYALKMGYLGTVDKGASVELISRGQTTTNSYGITNGNAGLYWSDFLNLTPNFEPNRRNVYLEKDDSIKIDLSNLNFSDPNDLRLYAKFYKGSDEEPTPPANYYYNCRSLLEVTMTVEGVDGIREHKELVRPLGIPADSTGCDLILKSQGINQLRTKGSFDNFTDTPSGVVAYIFQIREIAVPLQNEKVKLTIKPLFRDAVISLVNQNCIQTVCMNLSNSVPGSETYITSVGYFGGIKKPLKAFIDRQSGSLYDLFDYVLYIEN